MEKIIKQELYFSVNAVVKIIRHYLPDTSIESIKTYTEQKFSSLEECEQVKNNFLNLFKEDKENGKNCELLIDKCHWEEAELRVLVYWKTVEITGSPEYVNITCPKVIM